MADNGNDSPTEDPREALRPQQDAPQPPAASAPPPDEGEERDLWADRPSLKFFYGRMLLLVLLVVALPVAGFWLKGSLQSPWPLWVALALLAVAVLALLVRSYIFIWSYRFRVTTKRLFIEQGLLSKTVNQTDLIRVNDVTVEQTLLGRIFKVGTVIIDCPTDVSHPKILIIGVDDPHTVAEHIHREMRAIRDRRALLMEQT